MFSRIGQCLLGKKNTSSVYVIRYQLTNHLTPVTQRVERLTFTRIPVGGAWASSYKLLTYAFRHNITRKLMPNTTYIRF